MLGPGPLTVVALVVALGMMATTWMVVRSDPGEPGIAMATPTTGEDVVALSSTGPTPGPATGPAPGSTTGQVAGLPAGQDDSVTVDVAGKVRRPGIAVLDAGARVVDALKAAGGARHGVDLSSLNLARVLADGEQILVGVAAVESAAIPDQDGSAPTPAPGQLVNLNVATAAELESLPEVGPVTAAAIISWREANGGFSAVDELLEIDGIGETTLGQIAPFVTL